jgi:hypothetical protein
LLRFWLQTWSRSSFEGADDAVEDKPSRGMEEAEVDEAKIEASPVD